MADPSRTVMDLATIDHAEASQRITSAVVPLVRPGEFSERNSPTEESLAREWVAIHASCWRFDHAIGRWFHWNGARWQLDDQTLAFHLIGEHLQVASQTCKVSLGRAAVARGVESFARANPKIAISHESWDADPFLLGTPGGTVDLRTGTMKAADPADYITRTTSVAPAAGVPTRWLQFMDEVTGGDPDLVRFLQQVLGYCLTGSTREHALFFAYGAGKNGKSVFLNTASRILCDYVTTAAMDTFVASKGDRHPTDLARLDGARLVAASETEEGRPWAEARIKQLTGGDKIAARYMKQDFFEFIPAFKLFIVGNFQPALHSVDEATRRRFNIIPFIHSPPAPDKELEEKLATEHPEILAWMIEGARIWFENGLQRPVAVSTATDSYFSEQDLMGQWIEERCIIRQGALSRPADLFASWKLFALENGEEPGSQKALASKLEKRGFSRRRNSAGRWWEGIDLRSGDMTHDAL